MAEDNDVTQFIRANAHVTMSDLVEEARRDAERAGKIVTTRPRPGQIGVKATRFEIDEGHYLWVATCPPLEVRTIITKPGMLHAELRGNGLVLVDDQGDTVAWVM